jgi:hypothetical protein
VCHFFFASRFDPVLNGGEGDKDALVPPEVPGGGLVGQTVLSDQADGHILDATGVLALGQGQIGQVGEEVTVAGTAVMLGISDDQIDGATRTRVTQVMQGTRSAGIASSTQAAVGATPGTEIAAALFDARLGQVGRGRNALGDIGDVLSRSKHGSTLLTQMFPPIVITLARPDSGHLLC